MEILIHFANVLYLISYVMRDILWLRIFTIIAGSCLIYYFYTLPEPFLTPVYWNLLFVALNIMWVARLLLDRRPISLNAEEQNLCELVFRSITPREMINLLKVGTWESSEEGDCIVSAGTVQDNLLLIQKGAACVEFDGEAKQELHPGQFVGSISFLTDEIAPADVVTTEQTRYVRWPKHALKGYLTKNPELHAAIQLTLGQDLTKRLKDSWATSPAGDAI